MPPPPPAPKPAGDPNQGVLNCAGHPIGPNGEVIFDDVPQQRGLHYDWDKSSWELVTRNRPKGKQLVLIPKHAGVPPVCTVKWHLPE
jgi:hypothetical protein